MKTSWTAPPPPPTSPSPAGWRPTAKTSSSPTRRSPACGCITGIQAPGAAGAHDRRRRAFSSSATSDGRGANVRLQHCLGLAYADGHLYIADTYNNKIKICEPRNRTVRLLVGSHKPGDSDDPPHFYEPGGMSAAGTTASTSPTPTTTRSEIVDLKTQAVKTLRARGPDAAAVGAAAARLPNAKTIDVAGRGRRPGQVDRADGLAPLAQGVQAQRRGRR